MGNEKEIDLEIKKSIFNYELNSTSEIVHNKVIETLASLPERVSFFKKVCYVGVAAVIFMSLVTGLSFISPQIANAYRQIPLIGSIFKMIGDTGTQNALNEGFSSSINQIVTDKDISFTVKEVVFDGTRLSISYLVEPSSKTGYNLKLNIKLNNKMLGPAQALTFRGKELKLNQYAGTIDIVTTSQFPDNFNLSLGIDKIGNVAGHWYFNIPVSKNSLSRISKKFTPEATKSDINTSINIKNIYFAPSGIEIDITVLEKATKQGVSNRYSFQVFDDRDKQLNVNIIGNVIKHNNDIIEYKVVGPYKYNEKPQYLRIKPILQRQIDIVSELSKFPTKIDLGLTGQLTINKIEFLADKTLIYCSGTSPYNMITLVDSKGEEYASTKLSIIKPGKMQNYIQEFPPIKENKKIAALAVKLEKTQPIPELEFKILLNW